MKKIAKLKLLYALSDFTNSKNRWKSIKNITKLDIQDSIIESGLTISGNNLTIENDCYINKNVYIECHAPVRISEKVAIGPGTKILTATHSYDEPSCRAGRVVHKPVFIGRGSWIGAGVIITPGINIGEGCVIAAGSVVTQDCLDHKLYAGVPASPKKDLN